MQHSNVEYQVDVAVVAINFWITQLRIGYVEILLFSVKCTSCIIQAIEAHTFYNITRTI